jgi:phosphopantothenoylcysteine decarboxylase
MANVLLGVTGSVAAVKTPELAANLTRAGHGVKVVATRASVYFFDPAELRPTVVVRDEDEWPGRDQGSRYRRDDPVLHIELRRWADLLAIAPLDANTLAKLACGLADNCLTCVWRAWDPARPVVLAPAMNTLMWQHPLTGQHLRQVAVNAGIDVFPAVLSEGEWPDWINAHCPRLRVVAPVSKRLACGDVGVGGLAPPEEIQAAIEELLALPTRAPDA